MGDIFKIQIAPYLKNKLLKCNLIIAFPLREKLTRSIPSFIMSVICVKLTWGGTRMVSPENQIKATTYIIPRF